MDRGDQMDLVPVVESVSALRQRVAAWRAAGDDVALVPTMGALHEGHLSLLQLARRHAKRAVVSIFVNPIQFAPNEDFSRYPRTFEKDRTKLGGSADLVFAPSVEEMYPPGDVTLVTLAGPATVGLEDRFRPTHFQGVATVVAKLLIQALPDIAVFGEKDYQQLKVIARMATDLHLPTRIVPGPTLREASGLAMSSRNRYLSPADREKAALVHSVLTRSATAIRAGTSIEAALKSGRETLEAAGFALDYLEARDSDTLALPGTAPEALRLLVAARLGSTRLIDNLPV
jgi:pantoate--beta-alanine ligase